MPRTVVRRLASLAAIALVATAGCASGSSTAGDPTGSPTATPTSGQRPLQPGMQRAWVHGVGVDAPSEWRRNALRCGIPVHDTIVITTIGWGFGKCNPPKQRPVSFVWLGSYVGNLHVGTRLGHLEVTGALFKRLDHTTVNGIPARRAVVPTAARVPLDIVAFPRRHAFVLASSPHPSVIAQLLASVQAVQTDPLTGCRVHTHAYDDVGSSRARHSRTLVPMRVSGAEACYYVDDWLEGSAQLPALAAHHLARAIDSAPDAPVVHDCSLVPEGGLSNSGPMVLRFHDAGTVTTAVARIDSCHGWRSYVTDGRGTHRLSRAALRLIPRLWGYVRLVRLH